MIMKNTLLILVLLLLAATACKEKNTPPDFPVSGSFYSQTFIDGYLDVDDLEFFTGGSSKNISFNFEGEECSAERNSERFWELARRFGDTDFNSETVPHGALGLTPTDVDVTCDTYLFGHPSGASLKGIFTMGVHTYLPHIQNGYQGDSVTYIGKPLVEFSGDDFLLWGYNCSLKLNVTPPVGEYEFTVTVTFEDGSTVSRSVERTF